MRRVGLCGEVKVNKFEHVQEGGGPMCSKVQVDKLDMSGGRTRKG